MCVVEIAVNETLPVFELVYTGTPDLATGFRFNDMVVKR